MLTVAVSLLVATLVKAQGDEKRTPEERAKFQTEWMSRKLDLNETQLSQVEAINLKYAQKNEPVLKSNERKVAKLKKLKSIQNEKDSELKSVLSADQYKTYQELVDEMKEKVKERRG